jgi:hypothetical protein
MTKDIEETRKLNGQRDQVEAAVNELMNLMAKKEVNIGVSALMSYMCTLAYHSGYPLEKLIAYMTGLYQMHEAKNK